MNNTVVIGTNTYRLCSKREIGSRRSKQESNVENVYITGLDNVYCSSDIYDGLKK